MLIIVIILIIITVQNYISSGPGILLITGPFLCFFLCYALFHIIQHLRQQFRTVFTKHIRSWKARKYTGITTGTIIENKHTEQVQWLRYLLAVFLVTERRYQARRSNSLTKWANNSENHKEIVYSTIVQYQVNGQSYTIDLGEYDHTPEIIERRVKVRYDENNPSQAYTWMKRTYKKHLKVIKKDGMYIYCNCGLHKNIELPSELVDKRAVPGMFLIEKFGYYHLEDEEERKKSFTEKMENSFQPGIEK